MNGPLRFPFVRTPATALPPEYAKLRADDPITAVDMPSDEAGLLVTRYDDVRTVLTDHRFSRRLELAGLQFGEVGLVEHLMLSTLINMDPPEHTRLRRAVAPLFREDHAYARRAMVLRRTTASLDRLVASGPPAELMQDVCRDLPVGIICEYIGLPEQDAPQLLEWTAVLTSLSGYDADEVDRVRDDLHAYLREAVQRRRGEEGTDVVRALARQCYESGDLTELELEALLMILLTGGLQTMEYQLGISAVTLMLDPRLATALVEDEHITDAAIEELLRHRSAAESTLLRVTAEEVTLSGTVYPAGTPLIPALPSANNDPERFTSPDVVDFSRTGSPHLAFGWGIHRCLGAPLARLILRTALPELFRRLPGLRLAVPAAELEWVTDRLLTGYRSIPVTWDT